jgi:hypothetical protein
VELPKNDNPDIKRVMVGIPLKGHTPPESYHDRILMAYGMGGIEMEQKAAGTKPRYEFVWLSVGEIFIPYAREMMADKALQFNCDYLFMVDDDMMAPPDLFYRLVKHDVDIVAPLAFTRNPPHRAVMFSVIEGYDELTHRPYYRTEPVWNYPREKLVECDAVGFGAVLIKTDVLKKMSKSYFMSTVASGEDVNFCVKARKAGFRVFMDTATKLGHLSHPVIVTQDYSDRINKMTQEEKDKMFGDYHKFPTMELLK